MLRPNHLHQFFALIEIERTMAESEDGSTEPTRVDQGEYWRLEEIEPEPAPEIYTFVGKGGPPGSEAVAKAKQQYARDHDVGYRDLTGKKIGRAPGRSGGAIVIVAHQLTQATHEVLP